MERSGSTYGTRAGQPGGMSPLEHQARSRLARYLPRPVFPADRPGLIEAAVQSAAPEDILTSLHDLPEGHDFQTVAEVWSILRHEPKGAGGSAGAKDSVQHRF